MSHSPTSCSRARVHRCPPVAGMLLHPFRVVVARLFTRRYRGRELDVRIAAAAEMKMLDGNLFPDEVEKCRRLAARMQKRRASLVDP
jgi:hypothetical protein